MKIENYLWTEKWRPKNLEDLILPNRIKTKLEKGISTSLLFTGSPGTGKTSAAKVLIKQFKHPHLYINASTDTSVDVVRNRITDFCANRSIMDEQGKLKIILLDEVDGVSEQFFKAMRATMEQFHMNARFVATCNYINKVPEAIQSRFEVISFDFDKEEENELIRGYLIRLFHICKEENLNVDKNAMLELVKRKFPDLRSILNTLQGYSASGKDKITIEDIKKFNSIYKDVFDLIFNNTAPEKNYEYLISTYGNRVDDVMSALNNEFFEYLKLEKPEALKYLPQITEKVAYYQSIRTSVIDVALPLTALVFTLQTIVRGG